LTDNNAVDMIRLNPNQPPAQKKAKRGLFPPHQSCFEELFAKDYKNLLETIATTDDRMMFMAKH
jgi:hypothetical protein